MKHAQILLLAFMLMGAGCGKKYTCSHNNYYLPSAIAFTSYTSGSLPYFVVKGYTAQTQFAELLGTDTFRTTAAFVAGDTLCGSFTNGWHKGFFNIEAGIDYKITAAPGSTEFTITGVRQGQESVTWTQSEHCFPGAGQARITTVDFVVTGGVSGWYPGEPNNYFIFLSL